MFVEHEDTHSIYLDLQYSISERNLFPTKVIVTAENVGCMVKVKELSRLIALLRKPKPTIIMEKAMTKNYHLIANHKIIVQNPNDMDNDKQSGKNICPECDLPFNTCLCPKPWSSLKMDGYYISQEGEQMVAYPSLEVYEELMLWIFRNREHVVCGHCLKSVRAEWGMPEEVYEIMVEQFFAIHQECFTGENVEYFLIEDDGISNPQHDQKKS